MRSILVAPTVAFISALAISPAAFAQNQNYHYGMNAHDVSDMTADKMTELGADVIRVVFAWDSIEPSCKGCLNWAQTDAWRDEAARTGHVIYGTLGYTPRWANGGGPVVSAPPLDYQDWYNFVFAVVDRYKDDVFLWGIWNEPNLDIYLQDGSLKVYGALANTAHAAIRAANPRCARARPRSEPSRADERMVRRRDDRLGQSIRHRDVALVFRRPAARVDDG